MTTNQTDTKSDANPNTTAKQHAVMSIPLNVAACPTYLEKIMRDDLVALFFTTFTLSMSHFLCDMRLTVVVCLYCLCRNSCVCVFVAREVLINCIITLLFNGEAPPLSIDWLKSFDRCRSHLNINLMHYTRVCISVV